MRRGERGQALPLAILALVFGSLVVTPFLSHAGSSLIGSSTYRELLHAQDAADAGVEYTLWRLTNDGLAAEIPDVGDSADYTLPATVNGLGVSVSVTNIASSGSSGNIGDTVLDTLNFGPNGGEPATLCHVAGDVYAIVYTDSRSDGWVCTATIAADGSIGSSVIDSLEFDNNTGQWADIIPTGNGIFAIAYRGRNGDGFLKTVSVDSNGNIGNSVIDSLEFDSSNCIYPDMVMATGGIVAVAYQGTNADGFLKTVSVDGSGNIGSILDTLEFDTGNGREPVITAIGGGVYAIAYRGNGNDGFLKTVPVDGSGNIGSILDTLEFNTRECNFPDIIHIAGSVYAIAYNGASPDNGTWGGGVITTVAIASSGAIGGIIDEDVYSDSWGEYPDIEAAGGGLYAVAYVGPDSDGWLATIGIGDDGIINEDVSDYLEYDTQVGYYPSLLPVSGTTFAIAYTGTSNWYGMLKTFSITAAGDTESRYQVTASSGGTTVAAVARLNEDTVSLLSWQVQ